MATSAHEPLDLPAPVPWLVRCYPRAWRARYGLEFAELLSARPPTLRDRLDIIRGAVDARLRPQLAEAPPRREAAASDRMLAAATVLVGGLFSTWAGVIIVGTSDLWGPAFGAGMLGVLIAIVVLLGLIYRHVGDLRSMGTIGALVTAGGFLAITGVGGTRAPAILLIMVGTLLMGPGLARAVGRPVMVLVVGSTLLLASAMLGFIGGDGQELLWLTMLAGYGPAWMALGVRLRRGPRVTPTPPVPVGGC